MGAESAIIMEIRRARLENNQRLDTITQLLVAGNNLTRRLVESQDAPGPETQKTP